MWTDVNSKAELSVGGGFIRMNSEASLTLTNVSDQTVQLELDQGTLELTVRYLGAGPDLRSGHCQPGFHGDESRRLSLRRVSEGRLDLGHGAQGPGRSHRTAAHAVKVKSGEQVRFGNGASLQHTAEAAPCA